MKIYALLLVLFAPSFLSGCCHTDTAQPLILTCEDMALKRKPFVPHDCCIAVDCSK